MSRLPELAPREPRFTHVIGIGGIGTGILIELKGNATLARTESRMGCVLDAKDYCKLHIVEHYVAALVHSATEETTPKVWAVGNVGDDDRGSMLLREMAEVGIDTRCVRTEAQNRTLFSVSFLYPDKSGGNITIANSAANALTRQQIESCRTELSKAGERGLALCLPEVPLEMRTYFLRIATDCGNYRVASFPAGEMADVRKLNMLSQVDLLAINLEEAAALAYESQNVRDRVEVLRECARVAGAANPEIRITVSAGGDGVYVFDGGNWRRRPAVQAEVISTAGAGDALLAGVIAGIVSGLPLIDDDQGRTDSAIDLGLWVAAFSLTSPHSIHPGFNMQALRDFARSNPESNPTVNDLQLERDAIQTRS